MELKDLIGPHQLDAVDFSNELVRGRDWGEAFESCQVMRFRLHDKHYKRWGEWVQ